MVPIQCAKCGKPVQSTSIRKNRGAIVGVVRCHGAQESATLPASLIAEGWYPVGGEAFKE